MSGTRAGLDFGSFILFSIDPEADGEKSGVEVLIHARIKNLPYSPTQEEIDEGWFERSSSSRWAVTLLRMATNMARTTNAAGRLEYVTEDDENVSIEINPQMGRLMTDDANTHAMGSAIISGILEAYGLGLNFGFGTSRAAVIESLRGYFDSPPETMSDRRAVYKLTQEVEVFVRPKTQPTGHLN